MSYFANLESYHHIGFATCVHLCQAPSDPPRPWEVHTYGIHDTMSEVAQLPPRVLMKGPQQGPHLDADHCMPLPPGAGGREGDTAKPAECAACRSHEFSAVFCREFGGVGRRLRTIW